MILKPVALLIGMLISATLCAQSALPDIPVINHRVNKITRGAGKIFMNGDFNWLGTSYGSNIAVFSSTLAHDNSYPDVEYVVNVAVSDDAGGWYISSYGNIAHIKADKTIEELPITTSGGGYPITTMDKEGNILYIGGQFISVNGITRKYVAAINLITNTLTSWDPNANGYVYDIKVSGSTVYVGGSFSTIGGQTRSKIAAIDASTGLATTWNANVITGSGYVYTIDVGPGAVYFGGNFGNVGGSSPTRRNFAAVNTTTGALITAINPRPDNNIVDILLDGTTLYITGNFAQIAGITKPTLAALNVTTGALTSFNSTFTSTANDINALAVDGQKLFLGGSFTTINGEEQPRLAVVNKITGAIETTQDRKIAGEISALVASGGVVFAGGSITGITGVSRIKGLAALDENTGQVTTWYPSHLAYRPEDLQYHNGRVYYLTNESGSGFIGSVNTTDGAAIAGWQVTADDDITSWAFAGNTLYIGGLFTNVNGVAKENFAAVDLQTGNVLPWATTAYTYADGDEFTSMTVNNNVLYVAGEFSFINAGILRNNLAAWDATTGALLPWAPVVAHGPYDRVTIGTIHNAKVYLTGDISRRADAISGELDDWAPAFNEEGFVNSVAISETSVFLAGSFSPGLVKADINTGEITGWQPDLDDVYDNEASVNSILVSDTKLFAGGSFSYGTGSYYAVYLLPGPAPVIAEDLITTCSGTNASIAVEATGITYQWQKLYEDTGLFEDITDTDAYTGIMAPTLTIITAGDFGSGNYRCLVSTAAGEQPSNVATLMVDPLPAVPSVTGGSGCANGAVTLTADGAADGAYKWYDAATTDTAIPDAVNSSYTTPLLSATTTYYVSVVNDACESERTAAVATITLTAAPSVTGGSGCAPATFTLTAVGAANGEYRWYDAATADTPIPDAVNSSYTTPALSATTTYYVSVVNDACESERTAVVATITGPCVPPSITTQVLATQIGGVITVNLAPLISTAGNNLDINSIQVIVPPPSGANAVVAGGMLRISYEGIAYSGTEQVTIRACDLNGICATQQFNIEVTGGITVYNAVSPGGANPRLVIRNIELLPETKNNQVIIYDRWQNEVWRGTNYDNATVVFSGAGDGGGDLPTGTYFYKIEFKGGKKTQTGFISLKR